MTEVLIKDGVLYRLWDDMDETRDFEPLVIEHIKDIFGPSCEYFPKRKLKTLADTGLFQTALLLTSKSKSGT